MLRIFLFSIGIISLILGVIGIFLPLLPTTPFIILSAWCFLRSSPRMHAWLYRQAYIGSTLKDWENKGVIQRKAKVTALLLIVLSVAVIWFRVDIFAIKIGVSLLLAIVSIFIISRPEI